MFNIAIMSTVMYASLLVLMSIGFTFTHKLERFPNFAHVSFASIGTLFVYSLVRIWGYSPYPSLVLSAMLNGFIGVGMYLILVRPMDEAGTSSIHKSFAMYALSYVITTILLMYSYWILATFHFQTYGFVIRRFDIILFGLPGILVVAPTLSVILVVSIHLFLTRSRLGIAVRATAENSKLASSLGVNIFQIHLLSWFIGGALAGFAGGALSLWQATNLDNPDSLMVNILASSILGGLDSIYGSIIGGVFIAFTQRMLPTLLMRVFGVWIAWWTGIIPIAVIVLVQLIIPEGIGGLFTGQNPAQRLRNWFKRNFNRKP
ncbi:MAG TPA: branched-chain amino acid ABC transporter permease [Patescibacteria group bacterium]|nr:branched-chain amino acid ABC transporter permease [Patescibacteria group bacterium]